MIDMNIEPHTHGAWDSGYNVALGEMRERIKQMPAIEAEPVQRGQWIEENSVSEGYLSDWYISSVDNAETPIWTDEHIEELCHDFWLVPKTGMNGDEPPKEV